MINWLASFFYALGRFALGLFLHPYQTVQLLAEQRLFVWLSLLPTLLLGLLTVLWKLALLPLAIWLAGLFLGGWGEGWINLIHLLLSFTATWVTIYMIFWQTMLFYLLARFRGVLE